jgi:voltage-gated potassium channel
MAAAAAVAVLAVGVVGYTIIGWGEHSIIDALYMTVITLTTVGYGEIIPMEDNPAGRVFTMVLLVFGMGILVYFASTVTAFFVEGQVERVFWRRRMRQAISELKEHFIVCGDQEVGAHVIEELRRVRRPVVAVIPLGKEQALGSGLSDVPVVEGDPADDAVLREAGIARAAGLVAAMDSDRDNVLIVLTARQTNPIMRIVAMVADPRNEAKVRRAGADEVVSPPAIGGLRMASALIRPTVVTFLDAMLRDRDRNLRIEEITCGAGSPAIGRTVGDLELDDQPGLLLLAVAESKAGRTHFKPDDGLSLNQGDTLIVMGGPEAVENLRKRYGGQHYELAETTERPATKRQV